MEFDHQQAISSQAVERYLLGELASPLREAFEDHFFACPQCAEALRVGYALRENARALLRGEPHLARAAAVNANPGSEARPELAVARTVESDPQKGTAPGRWRAAIALPWAAALFLGFVVWKQRVELLDTAVESAAYVNLQAQARDDGSLNPLTVRAAGKLALTLDLPGDGRHLWTIRPAGVALQGHAPTGLEFHGVSVASGGTLAIVLDARRLPPGDYVVAVRPQGADTLPERLFQFRLEKTN